MTRIRLFPPLIKFKDDLHKDAWSLNGGKRDVLHEVGDVPVEKTNKQQLVTRQTCNEL